MAEVQIILKAVDEASSTIEKVSSHFAGLGKALGAFGKAAALGLGTATGAFAALGGAIAKFTIDAAPVAGIKASFEGLAESAGVAASEMLAALEKASAGMISQRDLMVSFNRAAQLVSLDFAKNLPEAMQYLRKVAASTGESLDYLLNSLVVGVGRLSPMILDNLGIQIQLTDAYERYAKQLGKSVEELTKQEQQTAVMNAVLEKLRENTAALPDITDSAQAAWAGLRATWQNLTNQLGLHFVPTLATLSNTVLSLAQTYLPPLIEAFAERVVPIVERGAQAFSEFVAALVAGEPPIKVLKEALIELIPPKVLTAIENLQAKFATFSEPLRPQIEQARNWLSEHLPEAFATLQAKWLELWPALKEKAQEGLAAIAAFWRAHGDEITAYLRNFVTILAPLFSTLYNTLRNIVSTVLKEVTRFWQAHGQEVVNVLQTLLPIIGGILAALAIIFQKGLQVLVEVAQPILEGVVGMIKGALDIALGVIGAFLSLLHGNWQQAWESVKQVLRGALTILETMIQTAVEAILGVVRAFGVEVEIDWKGIWKKVEDVLRFSWEALVALVKAGVERIRGAFQLDWGAVGRGIISGIAGGIRAAIGGLVQAAVEAARAAINAAKSALGIHSPSEVFRQFGREAVRGLALGLQDMQAFLAEATRDTLSRPIVAIAPAKSAGTWQSVTVYSMNIYPPQPEDWLRQLREMAL